VAQSAENESHKSEAMMEHMPRNRNEVRRIHEILFSLNIAFALALASEFSMQPYRIRRRGPFSFSRRSEGLCGATTNVRDSMPTS
jgi:hypothetical protein